MGGPVPGIPSPRDGPAHLLTTEEATREGGGHRRDRSAPLRRRSHGVVPGRRLSPPGFVVKVPVAHPLSLPSQLGEEVCLGRTKFKRVCYKKQLDFPHPER